MRISLKIGLAVITALLFVVSCDAPKDELLTIDPRYFGNNEITLSELADDISYVPLDDSIPIGLVYKTEITNDYIYLSIKDIGILQFSREGKLIRKIGSVGRGPSEYKPMSPFDIDMFTGNIYIATDRTVLVYAPNGKFIKEILLDANGDFRFSSDLMVYNSYLFFPEYISENLFPGYNWFFLDSIGNIVNKKENSVPYFQANATRDGGIYEFDNKLFYYNYYNDTVFSISSDLEPTGAYLFPQGNFRWPRETVDMKILSSIPKTQEWLYSLFQIDYMFETNRFIVLEYGLEGYNAIGFIDKKTKETFVASIFSEIMDNREYYKPNLKNDLDGGIPLTQLNYYKEGEIEYLFFLEDAFELKKYVESDEFDKNNPKYPVKKRELEAFANDLQYTDNPVLVLVRLK